jgi:hypothetical protein
MAMRAMPMSAIFATPYLWRRDDAGSKIAHETTDALALQGHARTPSGCKSGDFNRTIIKKAVLVEQDVVRLQVAVRDADVRHGVQVGHPLGHLY